MTFITTWALSTIIIILCFGLMVGIVLVLDYIDEKLRSPYDIIVVLTISALLLGLVLTGLMTMGGG